jgi:hypothetical protein
VLRHKQSLFGYCSVQLWLPPIRWQWYSKLAANQGYAAAQTNYQLLLLTSNGIPMDKPLAA